MYFAIVWERGLRKLFRLRVGGINRWPWILYKKFHNYYSPRNTFVWTVILIHTYIYIYIYIYIWYSLSHSMPWKHGGEWSYKTTFCHFVLDGVVSWRHALAVLPPGMKQYPFYTRQGGPQGRSDQVRKISPSRGFDPWNLYLYRYEKNW